jgi:hypothetical protein
VDEDPKPPKRRWWQVSLRAIFGALAAVAAVTWACLHPVFVAGVVGFSLSAFLILGLLYHLAFEGWSMEENGPDSQKIEMRHIWGLIVGSVVLGIVATVIAFLWLPPT